MGRDALAERPSARNSPTGNSTSWRRCRRGSMRSRRSSACWPNGSRIQPFIRSHRTRSAPPSRAPRIFNTKSPPRTPAGTTSTIAPETNCRRVRFMSRRTGGALIRSAFTLRAPAAKPPCGYLCLVWNGTAASLKSMLDRAGAKIEVGPVDRPGGRRKTGSSVYVRDPDGNPLEFMIYA